MPYEKKSKHRRKDAKESVCMCRMNDCDAGSNAKAQYIVLFTDEGTGMQDVRVDGLKRFIISINVPGKISKDRG